jgi:hypothetical protein
MDQTSAAAPTSPQTTTTIGDASAALAMADSSLATPAPDTTAASDAPAATQQAQPTTETQVPVSTEAPPETKGEPPKWRWQDILANARETSAKEAEARLRQEFESRIKPFEGVDPNELAGYRVMQAALAGDPQAIARVRGNPQAVEALRAMVAEQQASTDPEPEPDFVLPVKDAHGNIVGERPIYSAETQQKREAWLKRQWMAEIKKELEPLKQTTQTFQQREAMASYTTTVSSVLAKMESADPVFKQHKPDVAAVIQGDPRLLRLALGDPDRGIEADPETAIETAYARVYRSKVLPAEKQSSEAKVLTDLQQRAVAATTNPATASTATPKQTLGNARAALEHANSVLGAA